MRILSLREDTLVALCHQGNPMLFKPLVCILRTEDSEQPLHQPVTTRIDCRKVRHLTKRVGTVAASATAHSHLRQHMLTTLENGYLHLGHHLLQVNGQKETSSATTYNCSLHRYKGTIKREQNKRIRSFFDHVGTNSSSIRFELTITLLRIPHLYSSDSPLLQNRVEDI